jgi:hypothetical protein
LEEPSPVGGSASGSHEKDPGAIGGLIYPRETRRRLGNIPETKSSSTLVSTAARLKQKAIVTKGESLRGHVNHAINADGDGGSIKMSCENHEGTEEDEEGTKMSQENASSNRKDYLAVS